MNASDIQIEWDEDGCYVDVTVSEDEWRWVEGSTFRLRVTDPEQLYDQARSRILPWLRERDEARASMPAVFACNPDESAGAYEASDPKSEGYHDRMSAISDDRDAFEVFTQEDR